jgi:hypothetical protein
LSYKGIGYDSHGLSLELDYYFTKRSFVGIKYGSTFNWVTTQSQHDFFRNNVNVAPPIFFSGSVVASKFGYVIPISKSVGLKAQAELGLHAYNVIDGWELSSSGSYNSYGQEGWAEPHLDLLYELNIGMYFQL